MKFTKRNGVKQYRNVDTGGLYFAHKNDTLDIKSYVTQKVEQGNENTQKRFTIFRDSQSLTQWQIYVDNVLKGIVPVSTQYISITKDMIDQSIRSLFLDYSPIVLKLLQGDDSQKESLVAVVAKEIKKIINKRSAEHIVSSIEKKRVPYQIKNGSLTFTDTINNTYWSEFFANSQKTSLNDEVNSIFVCLDKNLFQGVQDGTFNQIYLVLKNNLMQGKSKVSAYEQFFISSAFSIFSKRYCRNKNNTLSMLTIKKHIQGVIRNRIFSRVLDMGKMLFHFTSTNGEYLAENIDINNCQLEMIRAGDALSESHATAVLFTIINFGRSIINDGRDYLGSDLSQQERAPFYQSFVSFFGGQSFFETNYIVPNQDITVNGQTMTELEYVQNAYFFKDFADVIFQFRNETFHYEKFEQTLTYGNTDFLQKLVKFEVKLQPYYIKKLYGFLGIENYFNQSDLKALIEKIHNINKKNSLFILPNFKELLTYIDSKFYDPKLDNTTNLVLGFLLKKIYKHSFICHMDSVIITQEYIKYITQKLKTDSTKQKQFDDFMSRIIGLSLTDMVTLISQQNAVGNIRNINSRLNKSYQTTLLYEILGLALQDYVQQEFANILNLTKVVNPADFSTLTLDLPILESYYENLFSEDALMNQFSGSFYLVGKLLPKKQSKEIVVGYKKYDRFASDIRARATLLEQDISQIPVLDSKYSSMFVKMIELCSSGSGNVQFEYCGDAQCKQEFIDETEHIIPKLSAEYKYIDNNNNPPNNEKAKLYHETYNRINRMKMYGVYDKVNSAFNNSNSDLDNNIGLNATHYLDEKLCLTNMERAGEIIIDLHSQLNGYCSRWERDIEYFICAASYLYGLSLADAKILFIYDGHSSGSKVSIFLDSNPKINKDIAEFKLRSWLMLPPDPNGGKYPIDVIVNARNFVDHWFYFREQEHSIIELYSVYRAMFSYDQKMRTEVLKKFLYVLFTNGIKLIDKSQNFYTFDNSPDTEYDRISFNDNMLETIIPSQDPQKDFVSLVEKVLKIK